MIVPMIHHWLRRDDLARLVAEIAATDPTSGRSAARMLECGDVDAVLDLPGALDAVRGRGGAPGRLPITLLWYVPIRAILRKRGQPDIDLADLTATIPVAFVSTKSAQRFGLGDPALTHWTESIAALRAGSVVQGERAAYCAALALWWAGCFPERITRQGGHGMLRAYVDFAAASFERSGRILRDSAPVAAGVYGRAAEQASLLCGALADTRTAYLGPTARTARERLWQWLQRLEDVE
jgi:hypothetical protein